MGYTKKEIESRLKNMLDECLESYNQDGSIISIVYDPEKNECTVKLNVYIVEEDNYVGFQGY